MEPVLFDHPAVQVTASAVHVRRGGSYFLSQISSVHVLRESSTFAMVCGVMFILLGVGTAFAALASALCAGLATSADVVGGVMSTIGTLLVCGVPSVACLLIGWWILRTTRPTYHLVLVTSAGQVRAIGSQDFNNIEGIRVAVLQAMSRR